MKEELKKYSSKKTQEIIDNYKKNERKILRIAFITLLSLIAYFSLIIGLFSFIKNNTIHWIIFAIIPFLIATVLISFKKISELLVDVSIEQKQFVIINIFKTILLYCLFDCFYLVVFNNWKAWIYITGVLSVFFVFIDLVKGFLSNKEILSIKTFGLLFNLLIAIIITIIFIYNIDDLGLRNIVIPIVASVYGGLITLLGVALSIKHNEKIRKKDREQLEQDRKEEEREKYEPYLTLNDDCSSRRLDYCYYDNEGDLKTNINQIHIYVSEKADCIIIGVVFNQYFYRFKEKYFLKKGCDYFTEELESDVQFEISSGYILIQDLLGNYYKFDLEITETIESNKSIYLDYEVKNIGFPQLIAVEELKKIKGFENE